MSETIAIIGAGYVGVPLGDVFAAAGHSIVLVDVQQSRVDRLNRGDSYVEDVPSERLKEHVDAGRLRATTDYDEIREADAILIALPTPLSDQREPDLSIVFDATRGIASRLRKGHLVVLESTTYPGTTRDSLKPILEESGLSAGEDFHLAFSPERVDPGREDWTTKTTPKVVGGLTEACTRRAVELYESALDTVLPLSSPEAAELTKLLENIFRSVNIALVNELAQLCDRMDLDVWEIVDAAATKPFGFMRFDPGPGMGGHCLPVDPFYLAWRAREFDFYTEFIELAGKINQSMPYFCVDKIVPVSTPEVAELSKLLENIFRSVNIALVNEMAMLCERLGIDVWEVIDAAASKPFGFMRFDPGPGMGGHCLPVDPFYLSYKAREHDFYTEFIELAGKINQNQPHWCVRRIERALNDAGKATNGSRVLLLGVSYKAGVGDIRESPALKIIGLLRDLGADVSYHDPHVAELPDLDLASAGLEESLAASDLVCIVTAHPTIDYQQVVDDSALVLDFRGVTRGIEASNLVRL